MADVEGVLLGWSEVVEEAFSLMKDTSGGGVWNGVV